MEGLQPMLDTFLKDHPEEYPEIVEGVKDLGKLKSAYSIAGFIWFYCEKRYENKPDSIGYDTWLEHEIIGGQKDGIGRSYTFMKKIQLIITLKG